MPTKTSARFILVVLVVVSLLLLGAILLPFAPALFVAAVLAGALYPFTSVLARRLGGRRKLAAGVFTGLVVLALVLPVGGIAAYLVKLAAQAVGFLKEVLEESGWMGLVDLLPAPLQGIGARIVEALPAEGETLESIPAEGGGKAALALGGVLAATTNALLQTVLMLIALFFLLVEGERLVEFLNRSLPFRRVHLKELLAEFRKASVAVLVSSVATAGIQATVALAGFLIARVPNALFFGLASFVLGLIPVIGAASVPVSIGVLLLLGGRWASGAFLVVWGLLVVAIVDNVVKPYLIKGGVELHGAVVFFSLLGGLAVFGAIGLLAGPLIVVFFVSALRIAEREFAEA